MNPTTTPALDPAALAAFAGSLASLPRDEIQKAKKLYIMNTIAEFRAQRAGSRALLVVVGILCIIPIFLIVFIPALISYRHGIAAARQKILNAVEVWRDELGADYEHLRRQAQE